MATPYGNKRLKSVRANFTETAQMKDGRRAKMYVGTMKKSGSVVCVVMRQSQQIFRGGHATLTDANRVGDLCWMMDTSLIGILKDYHAVEYLMTLERETGDLWVSKLADWDDPDKLWTATDPTILVRQSYRGAQLSYLSVIHHKHFPGEIPMLPRAK